MAIEIERKFVVISDDWKPHAKGQSHFVQGYFDVGDPTVRIRIVETDVASRGLLTMKSRPHPGSLTRGEWEYEIPIEDARELVAQFCGDRVLEKTRYTVPHNELQWEIDVFHGKLRGLVLAELELPTEDAKFERPDWLGVEVSRDVRFLNQSLVAADTVPAL